MKGKSIPRTLAHFGVLAFGIPCMISCNNVTPKAPSGFTLQVPGDTSGTWVNAPTPALSVGSVNATFQVLPLLHTASIPPQPPIVHASFSTPYPTDLTITATETASGFQATIPKIPSGTAGPSTGFFQVISVNASNPTTWNIAIRYPDAFANSMSFTTAITNVFGQTKSAPFVFALTPLATTVNVSIMSANHDGKVFSTPASIFCPGGCSATFPGREAVNLSWSVLHNDTEFVGWQGDCSGTGSCTLQTGGGKPLNATAIFVVHQSNLPPPDMPSCPAVIPTDSAGRSWNGLPDCGGVQGATRSCDAQGYFCCGAINGGTPDPRCRGSNLTPASCGTSTDGSTPGNGLLEPSGCFQ